MEKTNQNKKESAPFKGTLSFLSLMPSTLLIGFFN